ncbi:CubicO group peptidase, beta-lactamase class C family [Quadrisphaera sp. DSM 44207]|nr:CubicO group peptidase, beta-lactamase class C family [Quadrisphaera sp. DSM 44207]
MTLAEHVARWPVGSASVAVVGPGGVLERCGPDDARPWASVTKLLTALVVLTAAEDGRLDLDEPAGPAGSTVRHLLAHASGLSLDSDRVLAPPGRRRVYSNRGIELAAGHVERRLRAPFEALLRERVLGPLGMVATVLAGSPAHGARGPVGDVALLARELLRPAVLPGGVVQLARRTAFPGLSGVLPGFGRQDPNDWGLGPEVRGAKSPHWTAPEGSAATFGHFGQSGSFCWVDPEADVACACVGDTPFGPWAATAWPALASDVLARHRTP